MKMLSTVPEGLEEIIEVYGDCHAADFIQENIIWQRSPIVLRLSWAPDIRIGGFNCHRLIGPVVADVIAEIRDFGGIDFLRENDYDLWGGCFNPRGKTGGGGPSTHSWGISVDWCPALGPFGKPSKMPQFIVDAFVNRGFVNGGTWKVTDAMHNQACSGF